MSKLTYVENKHDKEDKVVILKDEEMHFDNVIKMVRGLLESGVTIVGFETGDVRMFFDRSADGGRHIGGRFKERIMVK